MKQLIRSLNPKHLAATLILFGTAIVILLAGPMIKINNQYPLFFLEKRLYLIALLALIAFLYFLLTPPEKKNSFLADNTPEAANKLRALQQRFQGAVDFLKKTFINKQGKNVSLAQLPWFLLIGPSGAGKTTLLANANINFVLTKQFKQEKITASSSFDWWATRDLVLVDTAGAYLKEKNRFLWNSFLNLTQQFRGKKALHTVIIALPLPELIKQQNLSQKKQIAAEVKKAISQLTQQFGSELNFYFILTKCDFLPGFLEFFGDSGTDELSQAWGVTLPVCREDEKLHDVFAQRFNALIKRLNLQLITRLHQERNSNSRPAIKDFPLQVERLKENMTAFLKALGMPQLKLHGVFLTSAAQSNTEEQTGQSQLINGNAYQSLQLLRNPALPTKAYFIRQLLLQGLFSKADSVSSPPLVKRKWRKSLAYTASVATVLFVCGLLGYDFQQSIMQTYAIQNDLAQYRYAIKQPDEQNDRLLKALPLLNSLQASALHSKTNLSRMTNLLSFYSDKSQKSALLFYQQALHAVAISEIKHSFENYLSNSNHRDPAQLYAALKAYLMLADAKNLDVDYVTHMTKKLFLPSLNKQSTEELAAHIKTAFALTSKPRQLNEKLIAKIRSELTQLSNQDLGLVILKNMNNNNEPSAISLEFNIGNPPVFLMNQTMQPIPNIFTIKAFKEVINESIDVAAAESLQGNWVIGDAEILSNDAGIKTLSHQLRTRYIANYAAVWEGLLNNLTLIKPTNLEQTDIVISNLMSNTSPLLKLLQNIKENTSNEPILAVSPKLHAFNSLLANANTQENTLYHIFVNLRQLHFYLQTILTAANPSQAAFNAAKNRMQDTNDPITGLREFAEKNPEPIKGWLNTIALQSWNYLLQEAGRHIENAWQVNIMTIYQTQFGHEDHEMDLQQVANFIGKQGKLATFYANYLKPFVNDTDKPWAFRVVDNQRLPFSSSVLDQIQEAGKLQNLSRYMLFTQGRNNPALKQLRLPQKLLAEKD